MQSLGQRGRKEFKTAEPRREISGSICGREAREVTPGNRCISSQEVPGGSARSLKDSIAGESYCAAGLHRA